MEKQQVCASTTPVPSGKRVVISVGLFCFYHKLIQKSIQKFIVFDDEVTFFPCCDMGMGMGMSMGERVDTD